VQTVPSSADASLVVSFSPVTAQPKTKHNGKDIKIALIIVSLSMDTQEPSARYAAHRRVRAPKMPGRDATRIASSCVPERERGLGELAARRCAHVPE
jgi:hypothetical protein